MTGRRSISSVLPMGILTDSYKTTHFMQYPACEQMVAYGEFRSGYGGDKEDTRMVFFGLRYILETYLLRQWTIEDVEKSEKFYRTHMAPAMTSFPFPKELFLRFIEKHDGYFPIKLEALPEGTCVNAHVPVYQITSTGEFAPLCTYLEVILTMVWYPTTVATLSRRARDVIEAAFEQSVEGGAASPLVPSRLHDFGFRGCCTVEQSVLGGVAHLLNFDGTDTLSAAYYAQFELNDGEPIGVSIPATEHSVMTSWPSERDAILNMISHFGSGIFACVMDSYDYAKALAEVVPSIAQAQIGAGGYMVLRPDSGDPVEAVIAALEAAEKVFGVDTNSKGYKVPRGCGVIQGDGIDLQKLSEILAAVLEKGFSAEAVAFGMGGGLLQKVNRDTMSFATKLSHVVYADGTPADIMKTPTGDSAKISFPGSLAVKRVGGVPTVFPAEGGHVALEENLLKVVYDHGPIQNTWKNFKQLRQQVAQEWAALPKAADVVSEPLAEKVAKVRHDRHI